MTKINENVCHTRISARSNRKKEETGKFFDYIFWFSFGLIIISSVQGLNPTSLGWGFKYGLFHLGITYNMGKVEDGQPVMIMRRKMDGDILPASLQDKKVAEVVAETEETVVAETEETVVAETEETVVEPVVKPVEEPVVKPVEEPVVKPVEEPVVKPVEKRGGKGKNKR